MLFFTCTHDALQRALRAATAARRPLVLRELLASRGETAFAAALSPCSGRVIVDALSMLARQESDGVLRLLSDDAQARQRSTCDGARAHLSQEAALTRPSLQGMLVWSRHA